VKAVVGDDAHLKAFEETLASSSSPPPQAQVGHSLPFPSLRCVLAAPSLSASIHPSDLVSSSVNSQVGLVVGKLSASSDRALVYALLPTPLTDAAAPACSLRAAPKSKLSKGGGRASSSSSSDASLDFDVEWIAEHARQVLYYTLPPHSHHQFLFSRNFFQSVAYYQ
jgi:hypothetical protein